MVPQMRADVSAGSANGMSRCAGQTGNRVTERHVRHDRDEATATEVKEGVGRAPGAHTASGPAARGDDPARGVADWRPALDRAPRLRVSQ